MRSVTEEHYFTADPTTPDGRRTVSLNLSGKEYPLVTASGVFSTGRLDPGTSVLLRKADLPGPGLPWPCLDLGCGYGPISIALATRTRSTVYAVDVNQRALELLRENASSHGLGDLIVAATPDAVPSELRFSEIWSNPPIRVGKPELYGMLDRWLPRLAPGGVAWLVISRNLGGDTVHRRLVGLGWDVQRHASQKGYRVLRVTRAAESPG